MDILYLVDRLENLISSSRRMPLMNQIIIKEAEILNIIDQMRTSIPEEIKQARRVIQDKERLIAQAQADASALLARAREESERAINREGLLRVAEERSKDMLRQATEHTDHLKNEADVYVAETLRGLRDHLANIEMDVSRSILSIEKGLESLDLPMEERAEDVEGPYDSYDAPEEAFPPEARLRPRSASLAADTMGGPIYEQNVSPWVIDADEPAREQNDARNASRQRGPGAQLN